MENGHGDDFLSTGHRSQLEWIRKQFEAEYSCKADLIGLDSDLPKSTRFLNRVISYTDEGIQFEADQRLVEAIVDGLGIMGGNTSPCPGTKPKPIQRSEQQLVMERRLSGEDCGNSSAADNS